jgi:hypothetical protein
VRSRLSCLPMRLVRASALAVVMTAMLAGCGSGPKQPNQLSPLTVTTTPSGEDITSVKLTAKSGGIVRGPRGAELFVPPGVLSKDGAATIIVYQDATIDFHIGVPWTGQVQVRLPVKDAATGRQALIGHRKRDYWAIEDSYYADGHIVAWVNSLSIFKAILCVLHVLPKDIAKCLLKEGAKSMATSEAKKLGFDILGQCGDVLDLNSWLGDGACRAGDPPLPWPTPSTSHAQSSGGEPGQPLTTVPQPPQPVSKPITHYDCPTDNGNKGVYVGPGHYWRSDPFTAKGSIITGGFVLIGANVDANNHQARVGIFRSADLSAPLATVVVTANGYDGENFTLGEPLNVTPGETLYLTVIGIGGFTAYDRVDNDCFIGRVDGLI